MLETSCSSHFGSQAWIPTVFKTCNRKLAMALDFVYFAEEVARQRIQFYVRLRLQHYAERLYFQALSRQSAFFSATTLHHRHLAMLVVRMNPFHVLQLHPVFSTAWIPVLPLRMDSVPYYELMSKGSPTFFSFILMTTTMIFNSHIPMSFHQLVLNLFHCNCFLLLPHKRQAPFFHTSWARTELVSPSYTSIQTSAISQDL